MKEWPIRSLVPVLVLAAEAERRHRESVHRVDGSSGEWSGESPIPHYDVLGHARSTRGDLTQDSWNLYSFIR